MLILYLILMLIISTYPARNNMIPGGVLTVQKMGADTHELITLYWGERLTPQAANQMADKIREAFPSQEVEIYEGGQPHYFFILSVE